MTKIVAIAERLLDLLTAAINIIACLAMSILTAVVFGEVLSRYIFKTPFIFTTELTALIFPWMVFLGTVAVTRDNEHLSINFIKTALPIRVQSFLSYIEKIVMLFFSLLMLKSSFELTEVFSHQSLRTIEISRAWPYYSMVVAFSLMSFVISLQICIMVFEKKKMESHA
jgi:TRAP-type C4-dicarboxylate transport system permease small subunit